MQIISRPHELNRPFGQLEERIFEGPTIRPQFEDDQPFVKSHASDLFSAQLSHCESILVSMKDLGVGVAQRFGQQLLVRTLDSDRLVGHAELVERTLRNESSFADDHHLVGALGQLIDEVQTDQDCASLVGH